MRETQETRIRSLGQEDPLEKEVATHASILTWGIPRKRSLAGYSLWDRKGLDTTEQASEQAGKAGQGEHV